LIEATNSGGSLIPIMEQDPPLIYSMS